MSDLFARPVDGGRYLALGRAAQRPFFHTSPPIIEENTMLPKRLREAMFEKTSVKTMRYVTAVPIRSAVGLVRRVFDMIAEDFFVNGSLSSHSQVPELFAGAWLGGREAVLVSDRIDRTTKEARERRCRTSMTAHIAPTCS